ncbi:MAG: thioredoxin domain-containing protein, partial [Nanoarchaeota archaeon]
KSFTSNMLGHCKEILTETNRKIKVTDEHEFFTQDGWKQAMNLSPNDRVAILPIYRMSDENFTQNNKIIIDDNDITNNSTGNMLINEYLLELKNKNLLPLRLNNENITVITRILGSVFSDGNLYYNNKNNYREVSFSLGTEKDVEDLKNDLGKLGFNKVHHKKEKKELNVNNRKYTINVHKVKVSSTSLWLLLKSLGAPVGDKTAASYNLPRWLMDSNHYIKREFLAAFMGGDGPKISLRLSERENKGNYNSLSLNDIEFHKTSNALISGIEFAKQLCNLFEELGVKTNKIFSENESYKNNKVIHIPFQKNFENAFLLYQNVGYRYANTKELESRYSAEFIRRILNKRSLWFNKYLEAINLNKEFGYGYRKVSTMLSLSPNTVWNWLKYEVKPTIGYHKLKFDSWLKENTKNAPDGMVWESIKEIKEVYLESVQKISMQNNHNFIANGFLAHNCGPCKAMAPLFEELSKEMKDVKFAKINVDDHPELASTYGVMGIPNFVVFKDGDVLGNIVGSMPKSSFKDELKKLI